jgi:hypothetical protein
MTTSLSDHNRNTRDKQGMDINPRRKRAFHIYDNTPSHDTDSFGFIADRSLFSIIETTQAPPITTNSATCSSDKSRDIFEDEYRAAIARLAPFLPIQLRVPSTQISNRKERQTRRRDWWATQKRRRFWRKNPTRKVIAYRRRRTFRNQK